MNKMEEYKQVYLNSLSDIKISAYLANHERFDAADYLLIKFTGVYHLSSDFRFILSMTEAYTSAFYSEGTILDFTDLEYTCGDEMSHIFDIGWNRIMKYQNPLAIIISNKCSESLKSLNKKAYKKYCVTSLNKAKKSIKKQNKNNKKIIKIWNKEN